MPKYSTLALSGLLGVNRIKKKLMKYRKYRLKYKANSPYIGNYLKYLKVKTYGQTEENSCGCIGDYRGRPSGGQSECCRCRVNSGDAGAGLSQMAGRPKGAMYRH